MPANQIFKTKLFFWMKACLNSLIPGSANPCTALTLAHTSYSWDNFRLSLALRCSVCSASSETGMGGWLSIPKRQDSRKGAHLIITKIHNRCAFYKKEGTRKENKLQCKICNESREVRREEFRARNCVLGSKK